MTNSENLTRSPLPYLREFGAAIAVHRPPGDLQTGKYDPSLTLAFKMAEVFQAPIETVFHPHGAR